MTHNNGLGGYFFEFLTSNKTTEWNFGRDDDIIYYICLWASSDKNFLRNSEPVILLKQTIKVHS